MAFKYYKRRPCKICKGDIDIKDVTYKKPEVLKYFMTERGKIKSRNRSGACAKHQRKVTREIKRARMIGLLPFKVDYYRSKRNRRW
ncbi:MAG TPA: 30S ribosomal protein S18 [Candidatus Mcinerneyibacterium sp.]|nr:30S ribosomal protein S18 [Candidatus Mcinerneyibacterium sp.]